MSDSAADMHAESGQAAPGETTQPPPPEQPAGIPPRPPLPPVPPYAAAAAAQTSADSYPTEAYPTEAFPTSEYPSPQYGAPTAYGQLQGYTAPSPGYPIPPGYPMPPQGYAAPQGYVAPAPVYAPPQGYAPPPQGYGPYAPPPQPLRAAGGSGLGVVAFALAVIAAFGATIVGSIAGYSIGLGTGRDLVLNPAGIDFDWSILTPVRGWVLMGELAFWGGTTIGIWALVQGIIAIVANRGRGWGIAAVVIAVIGPIAFAIGVQALLAAGFASGASVGG